MLMVVESKQKNPTKGHFHAESPRLFRAQNTTFAFPVCCHFHQSRFLECSCLFLLLLKKTFPVSEFIYARKCSVGSSPTVFFHLRASRAPVFWVWSRAGTRSLIKEGNSLILHGAGSVSFVTMVRKLTDEIKQNTILWVHRSPEDSSFYSQIVGEIF